MNSKLKQMEHEQSKEGKEESQDLQQKVRILWDLTTSIEALGEDTRISGNKEQAYNLCLVAQDLCLRLITELDMYKWKALGVSEANHYLTEPPNWQNMPRVYVKEFEKKEEENDT